MNVARRAELAIDFGNSERSRRAFASMRAKPPDGCSDEPSHAHFPSAFGVAELVLRFQ